MLGEALSYIYCCCFAVSLIWNGSAITGPILIYHDEIVSDTAIPTDENSNDPGDLVCRSASIGRTFWRYPTGESVPTTTSEDFYQVRTPNADPQTYPFLAQLLIDTTDSTINGLWICALGATGDIEEQDVIDSFIYVGIYSRNSGELHSCRIIQTYVLILLPLPRDPSSLSILLSNERRDPIDAT